MQPPLGCGKSFVTQYIDALESRLWELRNGRGESQLFPDYVAHMESLIAAQNSTIAMLLSRIERTFEHQPDNAANGGCESDISLQVASFETQLNGSSADVAARASPPRPAVEESVARHAATHAPIGVLESAGETINKKISHFVTAEQFKELAAALSDDLKGLVQAACASTQSSLSVSIKAALTQLAELFNGKLAECKCEFEWQLADLRSSLAPVDADGLSSAAPLVAPPTQVDEDPSVRVHGIEQAGEDSPDALVWTRPSTGIRRPVHFANLIQSPTCAVGERVPIEEDYDSDVEEYGEEHDEEAESFPSTVLLEQCRLRAEARYPNDKRLQERFFQEMIEELLAASDEERAEYCP